MDFGLIECSGKRLDNGELIYGAYVPEYTLDNPNEGGCIVEKEYGIMYPVDPKTVNLLVHKDRDTIFGKIEDALDKIFTKNDELREKGISSFQGLDRLEKINESIAEIQCLITNLKAV